MQQASSPRLSVESGIPTDLRLKRAETITHASPRMKASPSMVATDASMGTELTDFGEEGRPPASPLPGAVGKADARDREETARLVAEQQRPWLSHQLPWIVQLVLLICGADASSSMPAWLRYLIWCLPNIAPVVLIRVFIVEFPEPRDRSDVLEGYFMSTIVLAAFLAANAGPGYLFLWRKASIAKMMDPDGYLDGRTGVDQHELRVARKRAMTHLRRIRGVLYFLLAMGLCKVYLASQQLMQHPVHVRVSYSLSISYVMWQASSVMFVLPSIVVLTPLIHVERLQVALHRQFKRLHDSDQVEGVTLDPAQVALRWSNAAYHLVRHGTMLSFSLAMGMVTFMMLVVASGILLLYRPRQFYDDSMAFSGLFDLTHYSSALILLLLPAAVIDHMGHHAKHASGMLAGRVFQEDRMHKLARNLALTPMQLRIAGFHITGAGVRSVALMFGSFIFGTARHMLETM